MYRRPDLPGDLPGRDAAAAPVSGGLGDGGGGGNVAGDANGGSPDTNGMRPAVASGSQGVMATWLAVLGVIVLLLSVHYFPSARLTRVLVPVTGFCATIG